MIPRDQRRKTKWKTEAFEASLEGTGAKLLRLSYYPERSEKHVLKISYRGVTHAFETEGETILHNGRPVGVFPVGDESSDPLETLIAVVKTELFGAKRRVPASHPYNIAVTTFCFVMFFGLVIFITFLLPKDPSPWEIVCLILFYSILVPMAFMTIVTWQTITFDREGFSIRVLGICVRRVTWNQIVSARVEIIWPTFTHAGAFSSRRDYEYLVFRTVESAQNEVTINLHPKRPPWTVKTTAKAKEAVKQFAPRIICDF